MTAQAYDPAARRQTPLALKLAARIRREGPMPVAEYVRACLQDPVHGYYRSRPAIGAAGDFTTAPEISQIFGELIGLWCVVAWQQMGSPRPVHLVELGPGRGTLMRDALRAARVVPAFLDAVQVTLMEPNATLRLVQQATLAASTVPLGWRTELGPADLAGAPVLFIANEYLDVLAPSQLVMQGGAWTQRMVTLDAAGHLVFADHGEVRERWTDWGALRGPLTSAEPVAGLMLDYGHERSAPGDTLQAVRDHAYEHPLTSPGEADLTCQVDFEQLGAFLAGLPGIAVDGPVTQTEFLGRLGILERASLLMAANPRQAAAIEASVARLMAPNGMGGRFKAIGVRSAPLPPLPGLARVDTRASAP
jgi:SAM-dependent MidA family methyltransferase